MNKIIIFWKNNNWLGFESKGHIEKLNYNTNKDKYNLICCALSMHLQTVTYALKYNFKNIEIIKKKGYLRININENKNIFLLNGMKEVFLAGLILLKSNYKNYIKVFDKEIK